MSDLFHECTWCKLWKLNLSIKKKEVDYIRAQKIDLNIRKSGSAALDMAYVASGRFDGYFQESLNLWDVAAGIVLVKEAGGILNSINLLKKENLDIRASSSSISEKMLEKLDNF